MKTMIFVLLLTLALSACAPAATPTATLVQEDPITLRLAVADPQGRASEPSVLEFIEQVKTLSHGSISIEPTWDAGADTTPSFEQGVVKAVKEGRFDLGLVASRAWDGFGVTSFQALQAPFLITDYALADKVAASGIATRMLDGLSSAGVTGLALWPEDLRHPFSKNPEKPILSPNDLSGLDVRAVPSEVTYMLINTLGGSPVFDGADYQASVAPLGHLTSLPAATGNVTFFPKFPVLFANAAAFEKLNEAQRTALRDAAAATQKKAIEEHPSEPDAATVFCADGGTVVMASQEQVAAFEAAAKPVFDEIEKDPLNAELIADIRELKANTEPAPGAQACQPDVADSSEVWSTSLPPNGSWQVDLTADDLVQMGAPQDGAGTYTWMFQDSKAQIDYVGPAGGFSCQADLALVEDVVRVTYSSGDACETEVDDIQWRLDADGLHLHLAAITHAPFLENKAYLEAKPWQKISDPADDARTQRPNPDMVVIPGTHQDELGCSAEWQPDCNDTQLTYDSEDDVWQGTFEIQSANDDDSNGPRYKAAINGKWDENYGVNATQGGSDIPLVVTETAQVKFYYDHKTHWITDSFNTPIVVAIGDFQSQIGCANDNDATCLRSWLQDPEGDGTFGVTISGLKAGTYSVTFTLNEDAGNVISETQQFTVDNDGDGVYFGYDSVAEEMSISATGAP